MKFLIEVPVVDVDRYATNFHGGEIGLGILRGVVKIHADLGVMTEAGINQALCEASGAFLIVAPCNAPVALNERYLLWNGVGY